MRALVGQAPPYITRAPAFSFWQKLGDDSLEFVHGVVADLLLGPFDLGWVVTVLICVVRERPVDGAGDGRDVAERVVLRCV